MTKASYLVYDPKTDTLDLNDAEHALIDALTKSPEIKYKRIITEYLNTSANKVEAFNRLDEITTFYYNSIRYFEGNRIIVPFLTHPESLVKVVEILEDSRDKVLMTTPALGGGHNKNHIALFIYYKQLARTMPFFEEGLKQKELKEIAVRFNRSWKPVQVAYNKLKDSKTERLKVLQRAENYATIECLLLGDEKAIVELKKDHQGA